MIGIYAIINLIDGKIYVGKSINIEKRWKVHKRMLRNDKHDNKHLQSSWNINEEQNFEFKLLEEIEVGTPNLDFFIINREQYWIDFYNSQNDQFGYNLCPAGGNIHPGFHPSGETRQKMSISRMGDNSPILILKQKQKDEIREKYIPYKYTAKMLAEEYGVKESYIREVLLFRRRK